MNAESILAGAQTIAGALSLALLFRVRRHSVALLSTRPSYEPSRTGSDLVQRTEVD